MGGGYGDQVSKNFLNKPRTGNQIKAKLKDFMQKIPENLAPQLQTKFNGKIDNQAFKRLFMKELGKFGKYK